MNKYKIAIIDDEEDRIRAFKRDTDDDFEVVQIKIGESINQIIDDIISCKVRAIVVDFDLQTHLYSGIDIINEVDKYLLNFPSFVLTAFEVEAENNAVDVNKIYRKQDGPDQLIRRIKKQIEIYERLLDETRLKLQSLLEKRQRDGLSVKEEEDLLEYDDLIEKSIFKASSMPRGLKQSLSFDERVIELLENTEELLREVKKNANKDE